MRLRRGRHIPKQWVLSTTVRHLTADFSAGLQLLLIIPRPNIWSCRWQGENKYPGAIFYQLCFITRWIYVSGLASSTLGAYTPHTLATAD